MLHTTFIVSKFWLRHFVASVVSITIPIILVFVIYIGLVIVAIVTDSGLGSPVALPLWMLIAFVVSILYTTFLLFPSVWIAEITARCFGKWRFMLEIFFSTLALGLLIFAATFFLNSFIKPDGFDFVLNNPVYVLFALLIPLGIYWWTAKFVQLGFHLPGIIWRQMQSKQITP